VAVIFAGSLPAVLATRAATTTIPIVFTVGGDRRWTAHDKFKAALDRKSGVTGWVYHDIRRTVRSRLAELHIPYEIAERVLNHAMSKIERTYNRHAYRQEKAKALQAWADHLLFIVGDGLRRIGLVEAAIATGEVEHGQIRDRAAERQTASLEVGHAPAGEAPERLDELLVAVGRVAVSVELELVQVTGPQRIPALP
jgi:hypothetical protein